MRLFKHCPGGALDDMQRPVGWLRNA